jgi:CHAT domain-containing protein/tetratricopeptide (TPR) repeat protein
MTRALVEFINGWYTKDRRPARLIPIPVHVEHDLFRRPHAAGRPCPPNRVNSLPLDSIQTRETVRTYGCMAHRKRVTRSSTGWQAVMYVVAVVSVASTAQAIQPETPPAMRVGRMIREVMREADSASLAAAQRRWSPQVAGNPTLEPLLAATVARLDFKHDVAERAYAQAARDSLRPGGAYATLGAAMLAGQRSQFPLALARFQRASVQMARLGDAAGQAEALIGQALTTLRLQGVDSARTILRNADALVPANDRWLRARHACASLQASVRAADAIADSTWLDALAASRKQGSRVYAECLFAKAQHVESRGQADSALAVLDVLGDVQRSARLLTGLSATRQWQGHTLSTRGRYGPARIALREAIAVSQQIGSPSGEAWATMNLAVVSQHIGAWREAGQLLLAARQRFVAIDDRTGLVFADKLLAEGALLQGQLAKADSAFLVVGPATDNVAPQVRVPSLVARADIARRQHRFDAGRLLLDSATTLAQQRNMPGWNAEIGYQRGLISLATGQYQNAIAAWRALLAAQTGLRAPARFEVLSRFAEAEAADGRLDDAWRSMTEAQRTLDRWRLSRTQHEDRLAALQDRQLDWDADLGLATVVSYLAVAHRDAQGLAIAEWRRVRSMEQLSLRRIALVTDATRTLDVAVRPTDSLAIDVQRLPRLARARLPRSQAVVSYMVGLGGEPTTAFVLTRDTLVSVQLAPVDSLTESIEHFNAFLEAGRLLPPLARGLALQLLDPVLRHVPAQVTRLVFVPDGALHRLPFAALSHPAGDPLVLHYELAIAPSIEDALGVSSGASGGARGATGATTPDRVLVVGAPSTMPREPEAEPWVTLPGARDEARRVAALLGGSDLLDGRSATRDRFLRTLSAGGSVLHVATHAVADPQSYTGSGIALQPTDTQNGLVGVGELAAHAWPFELVVLSACATGEGLLLSGQALHGLVSTILDAGGRGVVATRWRVNDAAMAPHVDALYHALLAGDDVVRALHRVRVAAIRGGISPAVWANLEYFGDPALRVALHRRRWPPGDTMVRWGVWPVLLALCGYFVVAARRRRISLRR